MKGDQTILLVEDDKVDQMSVQRAFKELQITNKLHIVENGEEALEYLKTEHPAIILLDLNMPRMNGLEFLAEAKKDPELKLIPVIILTTSIEEQDKLKTFDHGVAGYMVKPVDYKQFVEVIRSIKLYWTLSELP